MSIGVFSPARLVTLGLLAAGCGGVLVVRTGADDDQGSSPSRSRSPTPAAIRQRLEIASGPVTFEVENKGAVRR